MATMFDMVINTLVLFLSCFINMKQAMLNVATPLWGKCEVATHTPENGTWESSGILEN
jgi:hypothetical protein